MHHLSKLATLTVLVVIASWLLSAARPAVPERIALFLLIGQSNMAGRGTLDSASVKTNAQLWAIDAHDKWKPARDPLHFDKPASVGVGPGLAFAQAWAKHHPEQPIGLIPAAVGGSALDDWQPGQKHAQTGIYAYDAMLARVKIAQKQGDLVAILWHQGESDSHSEKSKVYAEKLSQLFARLRRDLDAPEIPILLGTLGDFYVKKNPEAETINAIIANYPQTHPNTYVVSAEGLTDKGDQTHFDTHSARELGRRYAEILWRTKKK